jgi:hypothetical protein
MFQKLQGYFDIIYIRRLKQIALTHFIEKSNKALLHLVAHNRVHMQYIQPNEHFFKI